MLCGFLHACNVHTRYHATYQVQHWGREWPQVLGSAQHRDHAVSQVWHRDREGPQVHDSAMPENPHKKFGLSHQSMRSYQIPCHK